MLEFKDLKKDDLNIDALIFALLAIRANNEHVTCTFKGHALCSDTISFDSVYQEVYGKSVAEYDAEMAAMLDEHDKILGRPDQNSGTAYLESRKRLFQDASGLISMDTNSKKI